MPTEPWNPNQPAQGIPTAPAQAGAVVPEGVPGAPPLEHVLQGQLPQFQPAPAAPQQPPQAPQMVPGVPMTYHTPVGDPTAFLKPAPEARTINLADGRVVVMQRPARPLTLLIARVLGSDSMNRALIVYFRALAWVQMVNGQPMPMAKAREDFDFIANLLGDEGLEEVAATYLMWEDEEEEVPNDTLKNS